MVLNWEPDATIAVEMRCDAVLISANRAGLLSLANFLTTMAQAECREHIHLDEHNSLEDGSVDLIIDRIDDSPKP